MKPVNLRFADNTTQCANSESELRHYQVVKNSYEHNLALNRNKTKIMIVDRALTLPMSDVLKEFEKVTKCLYLGSVMEAQLKSRE